MPSLPKQPINIQVGTLLCSFVLVWGSFCQVIYGQPSSPNRGTGQQSKAGAVQEREDAALAAWESKKKYFIVVAANKTANLDTDLPFAKVDGTKVSEALRKLGYAEIASLPDKRATLNNFVASLKKVRELPDNSLVVVYYSGHGVTDPHGKDVWLQLYGQDTLGDGLGLSLSNLINIARGKDYKGELAVIIDACYSGQGALSSALTLKDLGMNTTILTSSSELQESYPIDIGRTTMSAFTHFLLEGFTEDWDTADDNHDGILQYEELRLYIKNKLIGLHRQGIIDGEMTPYVISQQAEMIAAYDPTKVKNTKTLLREALSLSRAIKSNSASVLTGNKIIAPPTPSPRAREIAKLIPNNADKYSLALKAIAEGRSDDARKLLEEAEKDKNTDLSEIYRARAEAEIYDGNFLGGITWLEKALQVSPSENVDLIEEAATSMFMVSDLEKAEKLFNKARELRRQSSGGSKDSLAAIFFSALISFMRGDFNKATLHFQQLEKIDSNTLEQEEESLSYVPTVMLALLDIVQDRADKAEPRLRDILAIPETKLKPDDPMKVMSLAFLSGIYTRQGRVADARELLKQFLTHWVKALDAGDVDKVSVYVAFASGFFAGSSSPLSNDADFEMVCQRSKSLFEKALTSDNPAVAASLTNLAAVYKAQKKYGIAESALKDALGFLERTVGPSNVSSVTTLFALGNLYHETGKYEDAERVFKQSLTITETAFGRQSIFTLMNIEALADIYQIQERYQEAEDTRKQVVELTQSIWGASSPSLASALENMAATYSGQKKYTDAEKLRKQALAINEKFYGPNHDEVGDSLMYLAQLYREQERVADAERFYKKALNIYEQNGARAQNLAGVLYNLGQLAEKQGRDAEAETYFRRAIEVDEKTLGYEDPEVEIDVRALAGFYYRKGKFKEAALLYNRSLTLREKIYGPVHPKVAESLNTLGALYFELRDYDEALPLLTRAVRIWEQIPEPETQEFVSTLLWTAATYKERADFATAETFVRRAITLDEGAKESRTVNIIYDLQRLGFLQYAQGKHAKAEESFLRSVSIQEQHTESPQNNILYSFVGLAITYKVLGQTNRSERFQRRAFEIMQNTPLSEQKDLVEYLEHYASLLTSRPAEALQLRNFAKAVRGILMSSQMRLDNMDFYRLQSKKQYQYTLLYDLKIYNNASPYR